MTEYFEPNFEMGKPLPDWRGAGDLPRTSVTGRYCTLAPASVEEHADDLFMVFQRGQDTRDWLYLPYGPFDDREAFRAWMTSTCLGEDPLFFAIRDLASGHVTGIASYLNIKPSLGSVEVGHIHFSPVIQRSPAATEAMYLMMRRVFEAGFRRYEWKCDTLNQRSRRAAERFGFSFEGVFRQHLVVKGRNRDTAWYACIDHEWPSLKNAYETWLAPDNFDARGQQRLKLGELTRPVVGKIK
ncbi:GNAT family N-acetyltransferase [Minwuia sp.]|uniref:GNAT family N-acetyltransferase n=1 Tax=Minwuia sp. TaxID=2493630 RepID=UPI003A95DB48